MHGENGTCRRREERKRRERTIDREADSVSGDMSRVCHGGSSEKNEDRAGRAFTTEQLQGQEAA